MTFDFENGLRIERYWDLRYEPKWTETDEDLIDELEERLVDCIRLHLVSDVPGGRVHERRPRLDAHRRIC